MPVLFMSLKMFYILLSVCTGCMRAPVHLRKSGNHFGELIFSFYHVGLGNGTLVIRFGGK